MGVQSLSTLATLMCARIHMGVSLTLYEVCILGVHAAQSFISNAREELPMGEDEKKMWFWLTILPLIAFGLVAVVLMATS